jgi:hypothetical protein
VVGDAREVGESTLTPSSVLAEWFFSTARNSTEVIGKPAFDLRQRLKKQTKHCCVSIFKPFGRRNVCCDAEQMRAFGIPLENT